MNASGKAAVKLAFHDADTNTDADTDILAEILARMSVSVSAWWNASFTEQHFDVACITGPQPNHGPLQFYPSRLQSLADPGGGANLAMAPYDGYKAGGCSPSQTRQRKNRRKIDACKDHDSE